MAGPYPLGVRQGSERPSGMPEAAYVAHDVVAMQTSDHPRLVTTALGTLERERASLVEQLASVRAKDYAEYLGRFSQIDGLNIAISHIKEAAKKLG